MSIPIFFLPNFSNEKIITLSEETSRHVTQVLRMKPHEKLHLANGSGCLITAEIIEPHKKKCTVAVTHIQQIEPPKQKISIAISLLKNTTRFEWFLEKATEIGVTEIIPLLCDRTEKQYFRHDRMQQIINSAMMQSQQAWQPKLHEPVAYDIVIQSSTYKTKLIAHCLEEDKKTIADFPHPDSVQILIGPEGDFTQTEITEALLALYTPVTLGNTRLRTETAGVVAATLLCI